MHALTACAPASFLKVQATIHLPQSKVIELICLTQMCEVEMW